MKNLVSHWKEVPLKENEKETAPTKGQKRQKRSPTPKYARSRSSRSAETDETRPAEISGSEKREKKRLRRQLDWEPSSPPRVERKAKMDRKDDRDVRISRKEGDNGRKPQESDRRVLAPSRKCESWERQEYYKECFPVDVKRICSVDLECDDVSVSEAEPLPSRTRSRSRSAVLVRRGRGPDYEAGPCPLGNGIFGPPGTKVVGSMGVNDESSRDPVQKPYLTKVKRVVSDADYEDEQRAELQSELDRIKESRDS